MPSTARVISWRWVRFGILPIPEAGDVNCDGTVDFRQGVEMYNYARRAGKQLVMLVYANEDHSAREKPNQIDYHRRILQWFGHYLKGEEAPGWITKGVTVIDVENGGLTLAGEVVPVKVPAP